MKKTLIVLMMVLLAAMLMVSCDDSKALPSVSKAGDTVTLGNVEWEALDVDSDNKTALLISKDVLELRAFDGYGSKVYANSTIHTYLKDGFISTYGLSTSYMKATELTDANVTDYVFLLSKSEVELYLGQKADRMAKYNGDGMGWWLRSIYNGTDNYPCVVTADGDYYPIVPTATDYVGLRPAFWYKWE